MKNHFFLYSLVFISFFCEAKSKQKIKSQPRHELGLVAVIPSSFIGNYGIPESQFKSSNLNLQLLKDQALSQQYFTSKFGVERYLPMLHYSFYLTPQIALRARYLYANVTFKTQSQDISNPINANDLNYLDYNIKSKEASIGLAATFLKVRDFSFFLGADLAYTKGIYHVKWVSLEKPNNGNNNLMQLNDAIDHFHSINPKFTIGSRLALFKHLNATLEFSKRINDNSEANNYVFNIGMNYTLARKNTSKRCNCKSLK